ncbi:hypothetical protein PRK78_000226 [Emydomyces testavorans]|uniref:Uncharacterized protein n=1 Tax=Emydomyces testavorans TaxID=2070801 RepID=A0AAF0DBA9_9EURO|nr:hypothetical protein PRK78_000226 [Emydomyces testavorans]
MESVAAKRNPSSKRRRFQAPITSYFASSSSPASTLSNSHSHYNYAAPTHSANPALPDKIQSSLLTVGMRVRKAVPEGYQTTLSTSKLNAYIAHQCASHSSMCGTTTTPSTTSYAELAPYCGGFKVGNLAVQSFPQPATPHEHEEMRFKTRLADDEEEESVMLTSSQDSTDSAMMFAPSNPHKRAFDQADDDVADDEPDPEQQEDLDSFYSPPQFLNTRWSSRAILRPKRGQKTRRFVVASASAKPARHGLSSQSNKFEHMWGLSEQENRDPTSDMFASADFEEAAFLRRREEVDEDFEMGGV